MKCAGCLKITKEARSTRCSNTSCGKIFCTFCIDATNFTAEYRKAWKCPDCTAAHKKGGDNSHTPIRGVSDCPNVTTRNKNSESKSESNSEVEVKRLTEQLSKVTNQLEEVTRSLNFSHERMEELIETIKSYDSRLKALEKRTEEVTILKSMVVQLKNDLNTQAQVGLMNEIEIVGIPESPSENLQHTVQIAAKKIGVDLEEKDLDWIIRVGPPRRSLVPSVLPEGGSKLPRTVVVRLLRRSKRDQLLKAAKSRKNITSTDLDIPGPPQKVYFNERLTKDNRILFREARVRAKREGYAYCWCNRGSIYVRQREGKAAIQVRGQNDLDRLFVGSVGISNHEVSVIAP